MPKLFVVTVKKADDKKEVFITATSPAAAIKKAKSQWMGYQVVKCVTETLQRLN